MPELKTQFQKLSRNKRPLIIAFVPLLLLLGLSAANGACLKGTEILSKVETTEKAQTASEVRKAILTSDLPPADLAHLFCRAMKQECRSSADHTVTLNQQEVQKFCRIVARAKEDGRTTKPLNPAKLTPPIAVPVENARTPHRLPLY